MIQEFAAKLAALIQEDVDHLRADLARGACADFPSYKELCGRIQGLLQAQIALSDLAKRARTDDDDED